MVIIMRFDVTFAQCKLKPKESAEAIHLVQQKLNALRSRKVKGMRFFILSLFCQFLGCQPGDLPEFAED